MSQRNEAIQIWKGIQLVFGMHMAAFMIALVAENILYLLATFLPVVPFIDIIFQFFIGGAIVGFLAIGLAQAIYVVPAIVVLWRRQQWGLMKGVIVGAVLTALLNGGCWLLWFSPLY